MQMKYGIRAMCGSPAQWYGLENSNIAFEYVPLFTKVKSVPKLTYVAPVSSTGSFPVAAPTEDASDDEDIFSGTVNMANATQETRIAMNEVIGGDTAAFRPLRVEETEDNEATEDNEE